MECFRVVSGNLILNVGVRGVQVVVVLASRV